MFDVVKKFSVMAVAAVGFLGVLSATPQEPKGLTVREDQNRVELRWSGAVQPPMLAQFEEAFRQREGDTRRIVIALNSGGGLVEYGYEVIALIRRMSRTHTIDTLVEQGRTCASMCVPIFLTGADRIAHPKAKFMFHEVSFRLPPEAERQLRDFSRSSSFGSVETIRKAMIVRATNDFYEQYFSSKGVNQRWITQMRKDIRGRDVWLTGEALVRDKTGVVDVLR